jgi:hypothetical protein
MRETIGEIDVCRDYVDALINDNDFDDNDDDKKYWDQFIDF